MGETSVFMATGDACPICEALDGEVVPAGFKPHPGCTCSTHVVEVTHDMGDCEWQFDWVNAGANGIAGIEVTVTCADGSELNESVEFDTNRFDISTPVGGDPEADAVMAEAEAAASELCAQCPPPPAPLIHC